jgi:hypothetical protein
VVTPQTGTSGPPVFPMMTQSLLVVQVDRLSAAEACVGATATAIEPAAASPDIARMKLLRERAKNAIYYLPSYLWTIDHISMTVRTRRAKILRRPNCPADQHGIFQVGIALLFRVKRAAALGSVRRCRRPPARCRAGSGRTCSGPVELAGGRRRRQSSCGAAAVQQPAISESSSAALARLRQLGSGPYLVMALGPGGDLFGDCG